MERPPIQPSTANVEPEKYEVTVYISPKASNLYDFEGRMRKQRSGALVGVVEETHVGDKQTALENFKEECRYRIRTLAGQNSVCSFRVLDRTGMRS